MTGRSSNSARHLPVRLNAEQPAPPYEDELGGQVKNQVTAPDVVAIVGVCGDHHQERGEFLGRASPACFIQLWRRP